MAQVFVFIMADNNGSVLFDEAFHTYEDGEKSLKKFMMNEWGYTYEEANTDFAELTCLPTNTNGETLYVRRYEMQEK